RFHLQFFIGSYNRRNRSFRICANLPRLETWDGTGVEQFVRRCSSGGNEECAPGRGSIHKEFVVLPFENGINDASQGGDSWELILGISAFSIGAPSRWRRR